MESFPLYGNAMPSSSAPKLEITCSPHLVTWLQNQFISLAFTTYQTNRLFFIGCNQQGLTGGNGADTFRFALADSPLNNFDRITDLQIGTDIIDGPNAVSAANLAELGAVSGLTQTAISAVLTNSSFVANRAATFSFGSRTFVALNNDTAGFSTSDAVIEITGFSGSLTSLAIA
ncbi:bluetail domain-containing putative surface protein [Nostoc sp. CCY 9925]|uniref:bluetail domain-containing putative surface protein n=1 Tax=Nostoc sp. CCY 9925 TaxID=3103865 RepID=UPI0039C678D2